MKSEIAKLVTIILLLILLVSIFAVPLTITGLSKSQTSGASDSPEKLIGFINTRFESDFENEFSSSFLEYSKKEDKCRVLSVDSDNTQTSQINAFRILLASSVDVIVFIPACTNGWDEVLFDAWNGGIPVISVIRELDNDNICSLCQVIYPYEEQAAAIMDIVDSEDSGKTTNIFYLAGSKGSSLNESIQTSLKGHQTESVKIKNSATANFMRSRAKEITLGIFTYNKDLNCIFTCNNSMLRGIIDGLSALNINPDNIMLCSFNVSVNDIDILENDYLKHAFVSNPEKLAELVVNQCFNAEALKRETIYKYAPYELISRRG